MSMFRQTFEGCFIIEAGNWVEFLGRREILEKTTEFFCGCASEDEMTEPEIYKVVGRYFDCNLSPDKFEKRILELDKYKWYNSINTVIYNTDGKEVFSDGELYIENMFAE